MDVGVAHAVAGRDRRPPPFCHRTGIRHPLGSGWAAGVRIVSGRAIRVAQTREGEAMISAFTVLAAWSQPHVLAGSWMLLAALAVGAIVCIVYLYTYKIEARRLTNTQKWILRAI